MVLFSRKPLVTGDTFHPLSLCVLDPVGSRPLLERDQATGVGLNYTNIQPHDMIDMYNSPKCPIQRRGAVICYDRTSLQGVSTWWRFLISMEVKYLPVRKHRPAQFGFTLRNYANKEAKHGEMWLESDSNWALSHNYSHNSSVILFPQVLFQMEPKKVKTTTSFCRQKAWHRLFAQSVNSNKTKQFFALIILSTKRGRYSVLWYILIEYETITTYSV